VKNTDPTNVIMRLMKVACGAVSVAILIDICAQVAEQ
jgi:hypothetical protein